MLTTLFVFSILFVFGDGFSQQGPSQQGAGLQRPETEFQVFQFPADQIPRRTVAFQDQSFGNITSWKWDFGDGESSTEKNPIHSYKKPGEFIVILYVDGPEGKARRAKVWDVTLP